MKQGYLIIATQDAKFIRQAEALASSIRRFDARPIAIVCDSATIHLARRKVFDVIIRARGGLRGTEHHLYADKYSPWARTLYVDTDCLVCNPGIASIWDEIGMARVVFSGRKITSGKWRVPIGRILVEFGIDHVVQNNGGVFGFDKSGSGDFFGVVQSLFSKRPVPLLVRHTSGGGYANEPFWATALALCGIGPAGHGLNLNVSTRRIEGWGISSSEGAAPIISIRKNGAECHPLICHFLGLGSSICPNELYRAYLGAVSAS